MTTNESSMPTTRNARAGASSSVPFASYGRSHAVIIGLDHYAGMPPLHNATRDAAAVASVLLERHGFAADDLHLFLDTTRPPDVTLPPALEARVRAPTKESIEEVLLTALPKEIREGDRVLLYFAGHGEHRAAERHGDWYMAPSGARAGAYHTMVAIKPVFDALNHSMARHVLYVLDACYSGHALARSSVEVGWKRFVDTMMRNRARQVLSSGTAQQAVGDGTAHQGHSPFTRALLTALGESVSDPGFTVTASGLAARVQRIVTPDTTGQQVPCFGSLDGHVAGGDFVFNPPTRWLRTRDKLHLAGLLVEHWGGAYGEVSPVRFARDLLEDLPDEECSDDEGSRRDALRRRVDLLLWGLGASAPPGDLPPGDELAHEQGMYRAIQCLRDGRRSDALSQLEALAASSDPRYATLARWGREALLRGGRRALLIGVSEREQTEHRLLGVLEDVAELRRLLLERFEVPAEHVVELVGPEATLVRAREALAQLRRDASPFDEVLVYYAGFGTKNRDGDIVALFYDAGPDAIEVASATRATIQASLQADRDRAPSRGGVLSLVELIEAVEAIPGLNRVLITDACHLAPAGTPTSLRFISACRRSETSWEVRDPTGKPRGLFSSALVEALQSAPSDLVSSILKGVQERVSARRGDQHVTYAGSTTARAPLFRFLGDVAEALSLAMHPWMEGDVPRPVLELISRDDEDWANVPASLRLVHARHHIARGVPDRAGRVLNAKDDLEPDAVARAFFAGGEVIRAATALRNVAGDVEAALTEMASRRPRVVVASSGPRDDDHMWRRFGVAEGDVIRPGLDVEALSRVLKERPDDPTLVVFDDVASVVDADFLRAITASSPSSDADRHAAERARASRQCLALRVVPPTPELEEAFRDFASAGAMVWSDAEHRGARPLRFRETRTELTRLLESAPTVAGVRFESWLRTAGCWARARLITRAPDARDAAAHVLVRNDDVAALRRVVAGSLHGRLLEAEGLLFALTAGNPMACRAHALLGFSCAHRDDPREGVRRVEEALALASLGTTPAMLEADVKHLLGRTLLREKRLFKAVEAFERAVELAPDRPEFLRDYAHAIQRLIDDDLQGRAVRAQELCEVLRTRLARNAEEELGSAGLS